MLKRKAKNPFIDLRNAIAIAKEQRQIANRSPYDDLSEVLESERSRGLFFHRDGARRVGPGPDAPGVFA
jgi:hypothetical protein